MTVLEFINVVRTARGLAAQIGFELSAAQPRSETRCVLALAMDCEIGAASHPDVEDGLPQYAMRFPTLDEAQRVARATDCLCCEPLPLVLLPEGVADIAWEFDELEQAAADRWHRTPIFSSIAERQAA